MDPNWTQIETPDNCARLARYGSSRLTFVNKFVHFPFS
jgi:hypothetical protein